MDMIEKTNLKNVVIKKLKDEINYSLLNSTNIQNINVDDVFKQLVDSGFISITSPMENPMTMSYITLGSFKNYNDGESIKPGNIRLNIKNLIETIPDIVSLGIGMASENQIITICGALNLWLKLRGVVSVSISKDQAFVIVALWKSCNSKHEISLKDGYKATNKLLQQYGENKISNTKYHNLIGTLVEIQSIELKEDKILLIEHISKKYIDSI